MRPSLDIFFVCVEQAVLQAADILQLPQLPWCDQSLALSAFFLLFCSHVQRTHVL